MAPIFEVLLVLKVLGTLGGTLAVGVRYEADRGCFRTTRVLQGSGIRGPSGIPWSLRYSVRGSLEPTQIAICRIALNAVAV